VLKAVLNASRFFQRASISFSSSPEGGAASCDKCHTHHRWLKLGVMHQDVPTTRIVLLYVRYMEFLCTAYLGWAQVGPEDGVIDVACASIYIDQQLYSLIYA
jgi:hypothetical protein